MMTKRLRPASSTARNLQRSTTPITVGKKSSELGQGALEYLMSYSWAILLVVMIGGSLYAVGVFDPTTWIVGRRAIGFHSFEVKDWSLKSGEGLTLVLGDKYGEPVTVTLVNATSRKGGYSCTSQPISQSLLTGQEATISRISDPSLVLYLPMDSISQATNQTPDNSPYGTNNGLLYNHTMFCFGPSGCPQQATGKINSGLSLDGADDYARIQSSTSLDTITSQLTIEAWLNTNSLSKRQTIAANWFYNKTAVPNIGDRSYAMTLETSGKFELGLSPLGNGTGATWLISNTSVNANQWVHVAAVSNGTNASIYLNGVLDGMGGAPPSLYVSHLPVYVGMWFAEEAYTDPYTTLFNGTLDEVRIYNRALSPGEIASHSQSRHDTDCTNGLSKGRPYTLDVKIGFVSPGGITHTDSGTITGKLE